MLCLNTTLFLEMSEQVFTSSVKLPILFSHSENKEKFDAYSLQDI